jgi:hypothetical protein
MFLVAFEESLLMDFLVLLEQEIHSVIVTKYFHNLLQSMIGFLHYHIRGFKTSMLSIMVRFKQRVG